MRKTRFHKEASNNFSIRRRCGGFQESESNCTAPHPAELIDANSKAEIAETWQPRTPHP
jgi:hypothetical protein